MPDFTSLDENLFAKVAQTLLQHIPSTHCNFKSALGPSILLLCVRLVDVQMNGFINYCASSILLRTITTGDVITQKHAVKTVHATKIVTSPSNEIVLVRKND